MSTLSEQIAALVMGQALREGRVAVGLRAIGEHAIASGREKIDNARRGGPIRDGDELALTEIWLGNLLCQRADELTDPPTIVRGES